MCHVCPLCMSLDLTHRATGPALRHFLFWPRRKCRTRRVLGAPTRNPPGAASRPQPGQPAAPATWLGGLLAKAVGHQLQTGQGTGLPHILLCRGSSKPWSLVCSTGSARGKGQLFSKRCGWRTRGMEGSSRLRHNSSTVTKFKHTKFKDPSLCFVSTQSRRPLERRQLRICQEDGKVRYAARALTDSPTAKDFPYRGGDTRWRHWWSFCSFALTIMYWFALRNLSCFFFAQLWWGPLFTRGSVWACYNHRVKCSRGYPKDPRASLMSLGIQWLWTIF